MKIHKHTKLIPLFFSAIALSACRYDAAPTTTSNFQKTESKTNLSTDYFTGVWGGIGTQGNGHKWSIVINLDNNEGSIDYASIPCSGKLTHINSSPTTVTLREKITRDKRNCIDNGKVVLKRTSQDKDDISFTWFHENGKEDAWATLKKYNTIADANRTTREQLSGKRETPQAASQKASNPTIAVPPAFTTYGDFLKDLAGGKTAHVTDILTDVDGSRYVLSSRLKNASDYRTDPDGTKSFLSDIILTRIGRDNSVSQTVLGSIYSGDAKGFSAQRGAFKIDGENIIAFYTEKQDSPGYSQEAYLYKVNKKIIGQNSVQWTLFKNANWGWYPYFDKSGTIQHFSFAGYHSVTNKERGSSISPDSFRAQMLAERMNRAGLSDLVKTEAQMSQAFLKAIGRETNAKTPIASENPVTAQPFAAESAPTAATAAKDAAPINNRTFPAFIDIPATNVIATNKGCRLNNPSPKPNESVTWSGSCRNGYADGHGAVAWFQDGKPNGKPTQEYVSKGFFLKPGPYSIFRTAVGNDACRIVVPVNAVENMKSAFSVEYDGRCPSNGNTIMHQASTSTRANILLNGQLFATFNGSVTMGAIPISGEMKFFDGTRFKFNGQNPFSGIVTQDQVDSWFKSIDVVRGAPQSPQLSAESLNIKVGFNAKPASPVEASGKLLIFSVDTISGATKLTMRYDIAPAKSAKLSAKGYVVSLKAEVKLDTTTSLGWFGVGESNSIVKLVDVRLGKENGYRATGEELLSELQSYAHGMGVTITTKANRPTVTVVGITEEQ